MTIDIAQVRADTRGCENLIHLNNAGASLPPAPVLEAVRAQLTLDEMVGGYEAQFGLAADDLAAVYASVASLVGGLPHEIALLDSSSRGWQSALYSMDWQRGDRIVTCEAEYPSAVFAYAYLRDRFGVETVYVGNDEHGQVDAEAVAAAIDDRTRLITATHVPTYGGLINPVAAVGKVAKAAGVPFLLDACQSVGQLHIDVEEIGCDMLAAAGRKFLRGPRGTAFLWVRESMLDALAPAYVDNFSSTWTGEHDFVLRDDARKFEHFERSPALHLGLGAAAHYAQRVGTREIEARVVELGAQLRTMLTEVPGVTVRDRGERLGGIVTFEVDGVDPAAVTARLKTRGINTNVAARAFAMRDFSERGLSALVRASVHYYNTEDELARLCDELRATSRA